MTVGLWMPNMLTLVLMTVTLMQGHSGSAKEKIQRCMLSATKQAITIKLATTVGHFLRDLDLDFANVYGWTIFFFFPFYFSFPFRFHYRPDMAFAVDWALKTNYLYIYPFSFPLYLFHQVLHYCYYNGFFF